MPIQAVLAVYAITWSDKLIKRLKRANMKEIRMDFWEVIDVLETIKENYPEESDEVVALEEAIKAVKWTALKEDDGR